MEFQPSNMEYKYSTLVDPATYETEGLCGPIPLRMHKDWDLEEIGTLRAQEDWRKLVGPVENYKGGLHPKYNFMAISVPECLPDRLEIISYANEFAFLYDDHLDEITHEQLEAENDQMLKAFREGAQNGFIESRSSGKKQIQSKMLLEMLSIDRERALTTMKSWAAFVELASGRQHHEHFATLEEYIPYRIIDVGEMFWFGIVTFGMAITIPEEEMDLSRRLMRPAWVALGLQNDIFSWQKEYDTAIRNGDSDVVNAVWVLMGEHSITADEAKDLCKIKIKESIATYMVVLKEALNNMEISPDLRKYMEITLYSISGNGVWSLDCPRYHPNVSFNERQLFRMKNGVSKAFEIHQKGDLTSTNKYNIVLPDVSLASDINALLVPSKDATVSLSQTTKTDTASGAEISSGIESTEPTEKSYLSQAEYLMLKRWLPDLGDEVVSAPSQYLKSLPSKGVRDQAIDALNVWVKISAQSLGTIKSVISLLHDASLMLDDLEDSSPLRREQPSTHTIFGPAQTVNSANYLIIEALNEIRKFNDPECLTVFIDEMRNLFIGQSFDLYWTYNVVCPTVGEYLKMIDNKTGGLFRLLSKLMVARSTESPNFDLEDLITLFGRYFQIRDDYQNLVSADYSKQKGFCEDLDEGKYSLPLIHALQVDPRNMQLRSVLLQRRVAGKSSLGHKHLVLAHLKRTDSLAYTAAVLNALHREILSEISLLEKVSGIQNFPLRLLLDILRV